MWAKSQVQMILIWTDLKDMEYFATTKSHLSSHCGFKRMLSNLSKNTAFHLLNVNLAVYYVWDVTVFFEVLTEIFI